MKTAPVALGLILSTIVGFAIWSGIDARDRAQRVTRTSHLASGIGHMRDGLTAQIGAIYQARGVDSPALRSTIAEKRALFVKSVAVVRARGAREDLRLMALGEQAQGRVDRDLERVLASPQPLRDLDATAAAIKPVAEKLHDAAHARHAGHVEEMDVGIAIQERALFITIVSFPLAFVLLGLMFVSFRRDERRRRAEQIAALESAALTDSLTGVGNHRAFQEALTAATAGDAAPALILFDLNELKRVNDRQGHEAGDVRLRALATAMVEAAGDRGGCFRNGGDEFAVVLPGCSEWDAFRIARDAAALLAGQPLQPRASTSSGVAVRHAGESAEALTRRADLALLESKRTRRPVAAWSPRIEPRELEAGGGEPHDTDTRLVAAGLARAVDARDAFTQSHCETVATMCQLVARELGFEPAHAARLRLAGLLHDVGKIGVPDAILRKPGALTEDEYETMKTHAQLGGEIVSAAGLPAEAEWVLRHHERPDGTGYPDGLPHCDIPLEALVIGAADAFEAMTAGRPYAPARTQEEAMAELVRHRGTQFDPRVVDALGRVLGLPAQLTAATA